MQELKKEIAFYEWLIIKPPSHWNKDYFFIEGKCNMLLNNLYKSFGDICPNAFKLLEKSKCDASQCIVDWARLSKF